jgi:hypothetical protein
VLGPVKQLFGNSLLSSAPGMEVKAEARYNISWPPKCWILTNFREINLLQLLHFLFYSADSIDPSNLFLF